MSEFGALLRAWRDRVRPEEVGLPAGPGRRAPGLRREELAALAGVSAEYVVRLEQGRAMHPSPQLLGALARALRLSDAERRHLLLLGGAAEPDAGLVPTHLPPGVQRMADRLDDLPLAVFTAAWDPVRWNPMWAAVCGDPGAVPRRERNVARQHFGGAWSPMAYDAAHREAFSDDLVADLRAARGRYPRDPGLAALTAELRRTSSDFAERWGRARIARHLTSRKTATTTPVGPIEVDCDVLDAPDADLRLVVLSAPSGSEDAEKLALLRVAGLQRMDDRVG